MIESDAHFAPRRLSIRRTETNRSDGASDVSRPLTVQEQGLRIFD